MIRSHALYFKENYPEAVMVLLRDMYMDDVLYSIVAPLFGTETSATQDVCLLRLLLSGGPRRNPTRGSSN